MRRSTIANFQVIQAIAAGNYTQVSIAIRRDLDSQGQPKLHSVFGAHSVLSWELGTPRPFAAKARTANDRVVHAVDRQLAGSANYRQAQAERKPTRRGSGRAPIRYWRPGAMN